MSIYVTVRFFLHTLICPKIYYGMFDISSLKHILPSEVYASIAENLDPERLREIRLRAAQPVCVSYGRRSTAYLTRNGISENADSSLIASVDDISNAVVAAAEHSVYAYNDDINRGYITLSDGARIGICGECVTEEGRVTAVKNYSSVNIRIPHEIIGCASGIMSDIVANKCRILLISAPGGGKTTMLRDIARLLSDMPPCRNILIADERFEIACNVGGVSRHDVGTRTDVISGGDKAHAFECAVRTMRPDVIITDEIYGERDVATIREAVGCGIGVIASAHSSDPETFAKRSFARMLAEERLFERYIFLSSDFSAERVSAVLDGELRRI